MPVKSQFFITRKETNAMHQYDRLKPALHAGIEVSNRIDIAILIFNIEKYPNLSLIVMIFINIRRFEKEFERFSRMFLNALY